MGRDRPLHDRQPEPGAARPPADERLEQPLPHRVGNAGTVVAHHQPHRPLQRPRPGPRPASAGPTGDRDLAAARRAPAPR